MKKLYYENPEMQEFTATVLSCIQENNRYAVVLDATAFYPEGGGQACDIGTLGTANVLDVQEQGTQVVHFCDAPLEPGTPVCGKIDWQRRFDLMQQHTGEHIVSGLLHRHFGLQNTGFHVGKELLEVDFDGTVTPQELAAIELEANEAVWRNIPLRCWIPTPQELPEVTYRTKRPLPWPVRIVQIGDVDTCACCGIHTVTTGQVGLIKIISCTKFHGGVRLEMACGARAYRYITAICAQNKQVSQAFSAQPLQTGEAAQHVSALLAEEKFQTGRLWERIFGEIAKNYVNQENILHFESELQPAQVRSLAEHIAKVCDGYAAVFSGSTFCLATREGDLRPLGQELCKALNGRGGGKGLFFQGSVPASAEEIRAFFKK